MIEKPDRPYVKITRWFQTSRRVETQRVPEGEVVYGVILDVGDDHSVFNVIPTKAGLAMMAAADDPTGRGWHSDSGDQVTHITYDQLSDEAIAALAVAVLLGEDDG